MPLASKTPKKDKQRDSRLRKTYGISLADYNRMLKAQKGGCAICGRPPKKRALDVDHSHRTGKVRGLLCHRHNRGLAWFSDDPALFRKAARYLARSLKRKVL